MKNPLRIALSIGLLGGCIFYRHMLEADPVTHVIILLPVLAFSGALFASGFGAKSLRISEPQANALSLVAVFAILFWMLPRYIDA